MSKTFIDTLEERGLLDSMTSEELRVHIQKPMKVYVGFDPTADSLHLGNLLGILALAHAQRHGHTPVVVLGGTTGRIGDPGGKSQERPLLDEETIDANVASIAKHFEQILDYSGEFPMPEIRNNNEWFAEMGVIDFLRDVGKHFRVGPMLAKESVRARFESQEGISFTEFSYQVIQGYDFFFLYRAHDVTLQMGGTDQWGNITSGTELIRKLTGEHAHGLTWPLLTRRDGKKFGKTEGGAIWLSPEKCSPYQFYQYMMSIPDADVIEMLKKLTFLPMEEIAEIEKGMDVPNFAQKRLAQEVTRIVHGDEGVTLAERVTAGAAPGGEAELDRATLETIASELPSVSLPKSEVLQMKYADLAVKAGLASSKGEANRLVKNGGAYLNNEKLTDAAYSIGENDLIEGSLLLIGSGKKKKAIVRVQ